MTLLNKLNLPLDKPFILTISSLANVGKTAVITTLASEIVELDNSILFITEDSTNNVIRRFINLGLYKTSKITIMRYVDIDRKIGDYIGGRNFDYIFYDAPTTKSFYEDASLIQKNQKISFFISAQLRRTISDVSDVELYIRPTQISDFIVVLSKNLIKNRFFEGVKKLFGLKSKNLKITFTKNKYGKNFSFYYSIDFKKINE
jgi:hypothetical protein